MALPPPGRTLRVIGFDDVPWRHRSGGAVGLVGAVCAGTRFEGMLFGSVRRDGWRATLTVERLLLESKFLPQLHLILPQAAGPPGDGAGRAAAASRPGAARGAAARGPPPRVGTVRVPGARRGPARDRSCAATLDRYGQRPRSAAPGSSDRRGFRLWGKREASLTERA